VRPRFGSVTHPCGSLISHPSLAIVYFAIVLVAVGMGFYLGYQHLNREVCHEESPRPMTAEMTAKSADLGGLRRTIAEHRRL
jgi:hypothetical protein